MLSVVVNAVRGSLERRSVARHRATLERLGHTVAEVRRIEPAAAVAPESSRPEAADASDPAAARRSQHTGGRQARNMTGRSTPLLDMAPGSVLGPSSARPSSRPGGWAPWKMRHPVVATGAAVGVLVGLLLGLTFALVHGTNPSDEPSASSPPATPTTTVTTTTTTVPPTSTTVVSPVLADGRSAVFAAEGPISVLVVAHGRSWVGVRNADGTSGFEDTLEPGDQQQIQGVSPLQIRLGSPTDVDVFIDGAPTQIPAQPGQPLDLTFGQN